MTKLTKAMVLQGTKLTKDIDMSEMGEGLTVTIRPLTEGEFAQAEAIEGGGLKFKGNPADIKKAAVKSGKAPEDMGVEDMKNMQGMEMEMDISKIQEAEFEAKAYMVATCIVDEEKWTVDDVKMMRPIGVVTKIAKEIKELSGITKGTKKAIKDFRKDQ